MSAWKTSTLGEVVSIAGGGTPTRSNPDFYGGTIPWVTPKDMKSWEITGAQITLTQAGVDNSATRVTNTATTTMYERDLAEFHRLLGSPTGLGFRVVELTLNPTPAFEVIKDLDKHSPSTSSRVKKALCDGPLFTFGTPIVTRIPCNAS